MIASAAKIAAELAVRMAMIFSRMGMAVSP
jgi:hypothetical protein